jgi:hypothetical protein
MAALLAFYQGEPWKDRVSVDRLSRVRKAMQTFTPDNRARKVASAAVVGDGRLPAYLSLLLILLLSLTGWAVIGGMAYWAFR